MLEVKPTYDETDQQKLENILGIFEDDSVRVINEHPETDVPINKIREYSL